METKTPYEASAVPPAYPHDPAAVPLMPQGQYPPQQYPPQYQPTAGQNYPNVAYQPTVVLQPGQAIPAGANVIIVQQQPQMDERVRKIKDLLPLSIVTTVCCSLLFGIIAIVYSLRVREKKKCNDYEGAKQAYKVMLAMNIVGIVLSTIIIIIVVIVNVSAAAAMNEAIQNYNYNNRNN